MKICFLGDGNSIHVKRWAEFFYNKGHEVHLITFNNTNIENISIHIIAKIEINQSGGNWKYLLHLRRVKKIIEDISPDIINAHYITSYGLMAALTGFKNIILTAWGSDILITPKKNIAYRLLASYSLRKAVLVTCESNYLNSEIKKLSNANVITIPMGVNAQICYSERNLSQDKFTFVSLRALIENSNIELIILAFAQLIHKYKFTNIELIIGNDGPLKDKINDMIDELKINEYVKLVGFLNGKDLHALLLSSNVHISIPSSDSTSVTLLEAMGSGIINIVSNIPANLEWITNGYNGLVLESFDEKKLEACMLESLNNNDIYENSLENNRRLIIERAIWEDNMNLVEKYFYNTIEK